VRNNFGNKNFMQPMGRLIMHPRGHFFSFWVWRGGGAWG